MRVIIPKTIEGARKRIAEIEADRRAKGWERAAIVWAHTGRPKGGQVNSPNELFTYEQMAEWLDMSVSTVKRDREAWKTAMAEFNAPDVRPGDDMTGRLPTVKYPPTAVIDGTEPDARDQRGFNRVATDPAKVAEAIRTNPAIAEAVTTAVAEDSDAELRVTQKAWARKSGANKVPSPLRPVTPMLPSRDYDAEFSDAFAVIDQCLRARSNGEWTPKGSTASLIVPGLSFFARRAEDGTVDVDIHDEIAAFLAQEANA